jgi:hypothetical protein
MELHYRFTERKHIYNSVTIKPNYLVIKPVFESLNHKRSRKQLDNEKNLKKNTRRHYLSEKAKKRLRSSINWLEASATKKEVRVKRTGKRFYFKVNFVTLTIPPQISKIIDSKRFQSCLNTFLTYARKYFYLCNYVWKIEASSDKRLHIHIMTDTFINHRLLKDSWNRILQKKGLLEGHFTKFGNYNPNSTDVHAIVNVHDVSAYVSEYMVKDSNLDEDFKGRIWGCSYSLSDACKCRAELDIYYSDEDYGWTKNKEVKYKEVRTEPDLLGGSKKIADLYFMEEKIWLNVMTGIIKETYISHLKKIREGTLASPSEYRQIDFLSYKEIVKKEQNYQPKKEAVKCATKNSTPKIG